MLTVLTYLLFSYLGMDPHGAIYVLPVLTDMTIICRLAYP